MAGGPQSGKSTMLRTLICSLALRTRPPRRSSTAWTSAAARSAALAGLPHVGGVATGDRPTGSAAPSPRCSALLDRREHEFAERGIESIGAYRAMRASGEIAGDGHGDVFLVVDGWLTLRQDFEPLESAITALAARGLGYGIHVIAATNKWSEFRPAIRDLFGTQFELRLGDPYESEIGRALAVNVPERSPGRGLTRDGLHFLTALPRIDGQSSVAGLPDAVRKLVETVAGGWPGPRAPQVRMLPEVLPAAQLPGPDQTGTLVPFGIDESTLAPVSADFSADPHFLILGDIECGKSNLLRLIADQIVARYPPDRARLIVLDYRRSLLDAADTEHRIGYAASSSAAASLVSDARGALLERLPSAGLTAAELRARSWWKGSDLFLVVDDYDLVAGATNPLLPLVDLLPQARDIGLHLILARSAGGAGRAMFEPVIQRLRELGTPTLLMSASKDEGQLFGVKPQALIPGRGYLVARRGAPRLVQAALAGELAPAWPARPERPAPAQVPGWPGRCLKPGGGGPSAGWGSRGSGLAGCRRSGLAGRAPVPLPPARHHERADRDSDCGRDPAAGDEQRHRPGERVGPGRNQHRHGPGTGARRRGARRAQGRDRLHRIDHSRAGVRPRGAVGGRLDTPHHLRCGHGRVSRPDQGGDSGDERRGETRALVRRVVPARPRARDVRTGRDHRDWRPGVGVTGQGPGLVDRAG